MSANCVITSKATRGADTAVFAVNNPRGATFTIIDTKLYQPVVTLSNQGDTNYCSNQQQDLTKLLNGTSIDQRCLIKLKITI